MTEAAGVTRLGRFAFMVGDIAFNIVYQGTAWFLLFVYTNVFGLPPTVAGLIYFGALACDALTDPFAGVLADRTRTRWGRFRPYLIIGGPFLALSYPLAYWRPEFALGWLTLWTLLTHCEMRFLYAFVSIPFSSLHSRLSQDPHERSVISGYRMIGSAIGGLSISSFTLWMVRNSETPAEGYFHAAIVAGVVITLMLWFAAWVLKEPPETSDQQPEQISIWQDVVGVVALVKHNKPLAQVFGCFVVQTIAAGIGQASTVYYFTYVGKSADALQWIAFLGPFIFMLSVPIWVAVANRTSKRSAWMIATVGSALALAAFFLCRFMSPWVAVGLLIANSFFFASFAVMQWSMLPDTIEYGEATTGERHEARAYGFASFAQKGALGFNAFIIGVLLDVVGYVPNQPQTELTQTAIAAMMSLIPLGCVLLAAAMLWRYPIDNAFHADLLKRIAQRRADASLRQAII